MENSQNTFKKGCVILTQPFLYHFTISQQAPQKHPASLPPQCLTTPPPHRLTATAMPHRLTATAMPHNPTASPPHRHRNASPPHRHTVGSRLGATEPPCQPRSGNCRLTAHRDATHGPPHCHPARSADATLPTLPQCRVAPWCDRATNPTAPPSVTLV